MSARKQQPVWHDMLAVATSGGPLAIALCFGAYSSCWFAVVGFLPTLQIERLRFDASTVVTALVTFVNVPGNLVAGILLARRVPRVTLIAGCRGADGLLRRWHLHRRRTRPRSSAPAFILPRSAVVPGALFTAIPVHAPRPQLVGAATGLLMQGSNLGALLGPLLTAALVGSGGWPAAAWLTSVALAIVAASGIFLHRRQRRRLAA